MYYYLYEANVQKSVRETLFYLKKWAIHLKIITYRNPISYEMDGRISDYLPARD